MALTTAGRIVRENATAKYTATVQDENEDAIEPEDLDTLTLTLYDQAAGTVINSRDRQNVLNQNGVAVASGGALTWTMEPDDNPIVGDTLPGRLERHVALFEWTYGASGEKTGNHEVFIDVQAIQKVPAA